MALFGLVFSVVAIAVIGIGIAVGLLLAMAVAALLVLGIFSSSTLVGLATRRPRAALRAFLLQISVLVGGAVGALCAWLLQNVLAAYPGNWLVPVYGALAGASAGIALALLVEFAGMRLFKTAVMLLSRSTNAPQI